MTASRTIVRLEFSILLFLAIAVSAMDATAQSKAGRVPPQTKYPCLSGDITPNTVVSAKRVQSAAGSRVVEETVQQRLDRIKARCRTGNLVDQKGRKIGFYKLEGCWGNPPADYLEILERQNNELRKMKRTFTVIEIQCDSSGLMPL